MLISSEGRTAPRVIFMTARNLAHRMVLMLCATAMTLITMQAFAHHGWAWAEENQSELKGTIAEISMAPPHPALRVKDQNGRLWQVDLGNPNQTQRSGFSGDTAKVGDDITVLGSLFPILVRKVASNQALQIWTHDICHPTELSGLPELVHGDLFLSPGISQRLERNV